MNKVAWINCTMFFSFPSLSNGISSSPTKTFQVQPSLVLIFFPPAVSLICSQHLDETDYFLFSFLDFQLQHQKEIKKSHHDSYIGRYMFKISDLMWC